MNKILEGLDFAKVYVDDILASSPDYETHLRHLDIVFTRLADANMRVKTKKCSFARSEVPQMESSQTQPNWSLSGIFNSPTTCGRSRHS
jgi:hypothetical protein